MPKSYDQFRYSDWEWIVVHFPAEERKDMARTAWLIAQCSADEITKHKQLDPRIVIPLCAIEFQDEINWEKLREFTDDFEDSLAITNFRYFRVKKQLVTSEFITNFIKTISDSDYWKNLFFSLELDLQFDLLHRLSDSYRRPERQDWRYIFQELKYDEFRISWQKKLFTLCVFLLFMFAIFGMFEVMLQQQSFLFKGLIGIALYIIIVFWIVPEQDPKDFIKFGFLGLLTFQRELYRLLSTNLAKPNIDIYAINLLAKNIATEAVTVAMAKSVAVAVVVAVTMVVAGVVAEAGVGAGAVAVAVVVAVAVARATALTEVVAWAWAWGMAGVVAGARTLVVLVARTVAVAMVMAMVMAVVMAVAMAMFMAMIVAQPVLVLVAVPVVVVVPVAVVLFTSGVVAGILTGGLLSIGILTWYRQKDNQNYFCFLAIFTFPLFCWFPILVSFATIFLLRFFSWQHTLLIWLISLSTCTSLWLYGQDKDNKARNPLKGIL